MKHRQVKVRLKKHVTDTDFWKATYYSESNLGIELLPDFEKMKEKFLDGRLSSYGSLEVAIPISYYNKETDVMVKDVIEYDYIQESKHIWEIVDLTPLYQLLN